VTARKTGAFLPAVKLLLSVGITLATCSYNTQQTLNLSNTATEQFKLIQQLCYSSMTSVMCRNILSEIVPY